jgi:hypothetical protein
VRTTARLRICRRARRRTQGVVLALLSLALTACTAAGASGHHRPSTTEGSSTSSSSSTTTTTTLPATFGVGLLPEKWVEYSVDGQRVATDCGGPIEPERRLLTDVFYPSSAPSTLPVLDAPRAAAGAPYPVIVFAHGYDQLPRTYEPLLDAWVEAGFVVVAPVFPCESAAHIALIGGISAAYEDDVQGDVGHEAGDVAFVIGQLAAAAADPSSFLHPILDLTKLGVAGQSDGGTAVGALVYYEQDRTEYARVPIKPLAVAILSGAQLGSGYRTPANPPVELSAESTEDECNPQTAATELYDDIGGSKWFLTIDGATHLAPYTGVGQWASATEATTTAWFELELGWRSSAQARSELASAGNEKQVTSLSQAARAPALPDVLPSIGDYGSDEACGLS